MIQNIKNLYGSKLTAPDGDVGHVKDFYFDPATWALRYLVVETGAWLTGRLVLLSPPAFGHFAPDGKTLLVNLTRRQIEDSPPLELHQPVTRQYETKYFRYYGRPPYWNAPAAAARPDGVLPPAQLASSAPFPGQSSGEKPLLSTLAVAGYSLQAVGGLVGQINGFLVDDWNWTIRQIIIEVGHWFSDREVKVPVGRVDRINLEESTVHVGVSRSELLGTSERDLAVTDARTVGSHFFSD